MSDTSELTNLSGLLSVAPFSSSYPHSLPAPFLCSTDVCDDTDSFIIAPLSTLLGNQALTLSPFCFSLKCPIWEWGLGAERRERAVQLQAHLVLQSVHYPIPEQHGLPSTQETEARAPPHRAQPCVSPLTFYTPSCLPHTWKPSNANRSGVVFPSA